MERVKTIMIPKMQFLFKECTVCYRQPMDGVAVSCGSSNKLSQHGGIKQWKYIPVQFWKPEVQNPGGRATSFEALGEVLFVPCHMGFWWPQAFLGLWLRYSNLRLCGHFASSSSLFPVHFLEGHLSLDVGSNQILQDGLISNP